ncbi:hypothetical protein PMIN02_006487 [Paraphaeosphaeria minitans]
MEAAVYFSIAYTAAVPSTLIASFTNGGDESLGSRSRRDIRDLVTISGPVVIVGDHETILPSGWVTVIDTPPHHNSQGLLTGNPFLHISIPAISTPAELAQTSVIPLITSGPVTNAAPQLGVEPALSDLTGPCTINTAPLDQQQSSYEDCQRTIEPGGICCIPGILEPSDLPSKTTASAPVSAPASPTSTSTFSWSMKSSTSFTIPTKPFSLSTLPLTSSTPPSSAPASKPSSPAPRPTEVVPPKTKTPILPILIPCSLVAVGIVALGIWCTVWRSRKPYHPPPPSVAMAPRVINGQKVFEAGNFAGAEAFERGIEEMGRKEKATDKGRGKWKPGGYRKYRESGTGSGLFGS